MNLESKGYVTCTGERLFRVPPEVFRHFFCVCVCERECYFKGGRLLAFEFFKWIFITFILKAQLFLWTPLWAHFFSRMQFKQAPSVMVIICELRETHILSLTRPCYSWDRVVEQLGKLQPKHNSCSLASLTFASLGRRNSRGRRKCD